MSIKASQQYHLVKKIPAIDLLWALATPECILGNWNGAFGIFLIDVLLSSCVACVEPDLWPAREHFCVRNQPLSNNVVGPVPCFAYYGRASPPWAWDTAKPPHSTRRPRFPHLRSSMPQDQWNAKSHRNTFLSSSRPSLNRGNLNRSHRPGPKSTSLKDLLSLIIMTLSPLMSLWTTPVRWMYVITCATCFITWAANSWGIADVPSWGCP